MKNHNDYYIEIEKEADDFIEEHKDNISEIIKENRDEPDDYIFDEAIYQK